MLKVLYPKRYYRRAEDIPLSDLKAMGIKGLILDVDNTLTTHNNPHPRKCVLDWLEEARALDFKLVILSNNSLERIEPFAQKVSIKAISRGMKPLATGYKKAIKVLGLSKNQVAMVGDQIFTDVLGANLHSIYSIMVEHIEAEEMTFFSFKRKLEKKIMENFPMS